MFIQVGPDQRHKPTLRVVRSGVVSTGGGLVALLAICVVSCTGPDPAPATVQRVIDDLAAQRFGAATALYRAQEELVLSPAAAPTWRRGLDHEDATVREWSVDALSRIGDPRDVERLVASLDDRFRKVQEAAATGLVGLDPDAARQAYLERLAAGEVMTRVVAAQSLAELGEARAVPALVEQLLNEELAASLRGVLAQSLATLRDPRAAAPLAGVALDAGAGVQLRRTAAEALATLEGDEARVALERLLRADDPYVRDTARRALAGR